MKAANTNCRVSLKTTAFGAALFAGLGVGIYNGFEDMRDARKTAKIFRSKDQDDTIKTHLAGWQKAVRAVQLFAD